MHQSLAGTASNPSTTTAKQINDWTNEFQQDRSGFLFNPHCAACAKFTDRFYDLL